MAPPGRLGPTAVPGPMRRTIYLRAFTSTCEARGPGVTARAGALGARSTNRLPHQVPSGPTGQPPGPAGAHERAPDDPAESVRRSPAGLGDLSAAVASL